MKALLLENIHPGAAEAFRRAGIDVETRPGSLAEDELLDAVSGVQLLGIRSNTTVTKEILEAADDLLAVGCFCIGTNQIDLAAAAGRGIAVFNAPYSNTRSVVELVLGEIVVLARRLTEKTQRMHEGIWDKSARGSHEFRGRTLGIVGYGNIGTQLSTMAEAVGLRVIFYDTADRLAHGNARRVPTLDALLEQADIVSIHVDGRPGNAGLFGAEQFARMKPRSMFINASRGMVIDELALREHILSGHIAGAAVDVFPIEPKAQGDKFDSPLRGLDNVILTPHIGGSTQEAQEEIGHFVSTKLLDFVSGGATALSVNLPNVAAPHPPGVFRTSYLHTSSPGVLAEINRLLADAGVNIIGQSLSTHGDLGYVLTDTDRVLPDEVLSALRATPQAVWLRSYEL
ncbi:phosphoglycerate dehydrogenase [Pseudonocardia sp. NPDC049635]|uniref:phosphoglycerate dehydrogenase n=1 Tax=Pseudonocardia sp. NPDC049635 TaxID=3155506 RepID=UPI0033FBFFC7